jgi:nitrile hydratase accessory protein
MASKLEDLMRTHAVEPTTVFDEAWEARVFAIAMVLSESGQFSWDEFRHALAEEISKADRSEYSQSEARSDAYYKHWLSALEKVLASKAMLTEAQLRDRIEALSQAAVSQNDHAHDPRKT